MSNFCHIIVIKLTLKCNESPLSGLSIRTGRWGFYGNQRDILAMDRSVAKLTVSLAATFGFFCAGNAFAADAAAVAVAKDGVTATVSSAIAADSATAIVVTQNNRQTNLQKTPTSILVMGIETKAQRRRQK